MSETEILQASLKAARESAVRGAEFLDERRPGWAKEIDQKLLNMWSPCDCILGQLYGCYSDGLAVVYPLISTDLGFSVNASMEPYEVFFPALRKAWLELIKERLAAQ